jgi:hypothetical protein
VSLADNPTNTPFRERIPIERRRAVRVLLFVSAILAFLTATLFLRSEP